MGLFDKKDGGFMNVIRCDEPSYLIWKWHPSGTDPQKSRRANAVRWLSLIHI